MFPVLSASRSKLSKSRAQTGETDTPVDTTENTLYAALAAVNTDSLVTITTMHYNVT